MPRAFDSNNAVSAVTLPQLAELTGLTTRGIEKQIAQIKEQRKLKRIGSGNGGHWFVVNAINKK